METNQLEVNTKLLPSDTELKINKIIEDVVVSTIDVLDIDKMIDYILQHTQAFFQKIYNSEQECFLIEALARPDPKIMGVGEQKIESLMRLLALIENKGKTFRLFKHMLNLIQEKIDENSENANCKYSINAYPEDILNPDFISLIKNFPYPNKLVIELSEKKIWPEESIELLKHVQANFGIRVALDDINPTASENNSTMDTLNKCRDAECTLDLGKIDGPYFQYLADNNNYIGLKHRILEDYQKSGIKNFIIEYIETEEQFIFAKQLEIDNDLRELGIRFGYQGFYFGKDI